VSKEPGSVAALGSDDCLRGLCAARRLRLGTPAYLAQVAWVAPENAGIGPQSLGTEPTQFDRQRVREVGAATANKADARRHHRGKQDQEGTAGAHARAGKAGLRSSIGKAGLRSSIGKAAAHCSHLDDLRNREVPTREKADRAQPVAAAPLQDV
jgi:hypothetical protein